MTKIIDKINARRNQRLYASSGQEEEELQYADQEETQNKKSFNPSWYYSFEFFPPKTEAGLDNLFTRIDRMTRRLEPLFIDVTWGSAGSTSARTMAVASYAQRYCGVDVLMHLTTTGMTRDAIVSVLQQAKMHGIRNILALRGDPPKGKRSWQVGDVSDGECNRAIDLVKLIKEEFMDYFCVAIAGHPEGHPSSVSLEEEMTHMKQKVDAGAEFIITQFFYDVDIFLDFVKRCREYGIMCPILPGIMPIQSFSSFIRMTEYCNITVPKHIMERLEPVKDDDEAVKEIGCEIAVEMCQKILNAKIGKEDYNQGVDAVHFYTLNLERSVTRILFDVGAIDLIHPAVVAADASSKSKTEDGASSLLKTMDTMPSSAETIRCNSSSARPLPWRPSAMDQRSKEEVRPINWANRPKSYVRRTEDWDEFPNGK